jgi:dCTP diphosphatase
VHWGDRTESRRSVAASERRLSGQFANLKGETRRDVASLVMDINQLQMRLRQFAREREWEQYHTPKNLAAALSVEASELLEVFQWLTPDESQHLKTGQKEQASQEIADIAIYLVRIADCLGVDIEEAINSKLRLNSEKYPVELAKGNATKYDKRVD